MKRFLSQWLSIIFLVALYNVTNCFAQRNIFNVPEADIVNAKELLFQQQITITEDEDIQAGTTFTYGLGKGWEVGLNINNITLHYRPVHQPIMELASEKPEQNPDITLNLQKGIDFTDWFILGIGTRTGVGYINKISEVKLANFSYFIGEFTIEGPEVKLYGGSYYTTPAFAGQGNRLGYMAAFQVPLIQEKLFVEGEYISGTNMYSNITSGLMLNLGKKWQLAAGAQLPSPGSKNSYGATLQLSTR